MRGAKVTQLADILKRASQDHRIGITAVLEDAPVERVRTHWPGQASRLEWMRTWHAPGHVEGFLSDTGAVAQIVTGLDIEPGSKLRVLVLWGGGVPPLEADTCILSQVRVRWSDLAAELEATGFGEVECEPSSAVGGVAANGRPSREKPFWPAARNIAEEWLSENGYPEFGDGGQAALEKHVAQWLEVRGYTASESTVRRHVKRWIKEFIAELDRRALGS